jgi:hypothetical protein
VCRLGSGSRGGSLDAEALWGIEEVDVVLLLDRARLGGSGRVSLGSGLAVSLSASIILSSDGNSILDALLTGLRVWSMM